MDCPNGQKTKKGTINPKNKDEKSFQQAITVASNYKNIVRDP